MSLDILEKVKDFLVRLVKDEAFRTQLMSEKLEEVMTVLENGGYYFSQEEFENAAIKILELKESGEFQDLSEEELVGAIGGLTVISDTDRVIQPLYGIIVDPLPVNPKPKPIQWIPKPWPRPIPKPWPQPMYGIIIDPPVQAHYGVVVPYDLI
ncbi:Nif11-like leader peptide family RiPP precursor [Fortiea contorta]|uniref:Nif11-like leader peptide family RiPP precursor n=1 Tax=Fortiea contorta TaxID=1892405 RepID=UPI000344D0FA|nr:Nif11-like leader peptide family RiPP precursor [Fortiea contorta]